MVARVGFGELLGYNGLTVNRWQNQTAICRTLHLAAADIGPSASGRAGCIERRPKAGRMRLPPAGYMLDRADQSGEENTVGT